MKHIILKIIKRLYRHFSKPISLAILNGILIIILISLNLYFQAFCIPTTWTIVVLAICFINTILYPILEKTKFAPLTSFINGITLFVFTYCVIFLEHMNFFRTYIYSNRNRFSDFYTTFFYYSTDLEKCFQTCN